MDTSQGNDVEIVGSVSHQDNDENNDTAGLAPDNSTSNITQPIEKWSKTPRAKGRQARDPFAQSLTLQCATVEDLETMLRDYLAAPTCDAHHTTLEFSFPLSAAFLVHAPDFKNEPNVGQTNKQVLFRVLNRTAISATDALAPTEDTKLQMRKQKAIARAIVHAIEKADGFRYSFHNNWVSKADEASRFSFYCNDSTLNKGRAANEGAETKGKSARKPVYECEGLISVKFSATKQSLEAHYKHVPLHKTYEERAPPPRKDSKRMKLMEIFNPEQVPLIPKRRGRKPYNIPSVPRRRKTTEPVAANPSGSTVHGAQTAPLEPLAAFLDAAERAGEDPGPDDMDPSQIDAAQQAQLNDTERPRGPAEKRSELRKKRPQPAIKPKPPKPNPFPGMMSGRMDGNAISWAPGQHPAARPMPPPYAYVPAPIPYGGYPPVSMVGPPGSMPQPAPIMVAGPHTIVQPPGHASIRLPDPAPQQPPPPTQPAQSAQPTGPTSEVDALKAKLLEAEQRIQRLEAERFGQTGPPYHQFHPPPPAGWGPPVAYPYPPPQGYPPYFAPPPPPQYAPRPPPQPIPRAPPPTTAPVPATTSNAAPASQASAATPASGQTPTPATT